MNTGLDNTLPDTIDALKRLVLSQQKTLQNNQHQLTKKQARIQFLEEQVILFKHRQFGKSSEKSVRQVELFDEVEAHAELTAPDNVDPIETTLDQPAPKLAKSGRKPLPKTLPRVRIEHDLPEAEKRCQCGCQKTCIGEDTSEQLDIVPAVVQVLVHVRKKYACKGCESGITVADLPKQPIAKSNASPGLLAHIAVAKYQDGLPLYRMETVFKRLGLHLPRNTQANWMIQCGKLLQPLYNLLNEQLLDSGYIHMDETRVQVLKEPDKLSESLSYMWVRRTGDLEHPIILFDYASSRKASVVDSLLGDYRGYLQTDDYAGYHATGNREGVIALGCMAHARRKFVDAQKVTATKKGKVSKADIAVGMIKVLYAIEADIKEKAPGEKYLIRQQKCQAQLTKIKLWLDKAVQQTLPKGKTGEAIAYTLKNWKKLTAYVEDGRLNIDNNPVENAIRPFAIGRNYVHNRIMFSSHTTHKNGTANPPYGKDGSPKYVHIIRGFPKRLIPTQLA